MNSSRFSTAYTASAVFGSLETLAPISLEVLDPNGSYFKFNLDTINLYNLIRLEGSSYFRSIYTKTYDILRNTTDDHHNAHFNMIDRALRGPNAARDASTRLYLELWLLRPRRDVQVDLTGVYRACERTAPAIRSGGAARDDGFSLAAKSVSARGRRLRSDRRRGNRLHPAVLDGAIYGVL